MEERFKTFTVLIAKISRNIRKIKTEEMSEMNLKSPHVSCLYYLFKAGALTAKELSDVCEEDKAAISRSIDYLEKEGYLQCDSQAKKRYRAHLSLTEKGEKVGRFIADKIDNILALASEGLTEENRTIFYQSLTLISDNLQKICNEYGE
ncbi:MAG: transcriptional regulator [Clostridia bacterium]|nr:transcriptional regulator [Clostridia bacterium]